MNFREKLIRFMQGRYGIDQLSKFILVIGVVCVLISALFGDHPAALIPYFLGWILVIYSYYRVFSRNVTKRYAENQTFLAKTRSASRKERERSKCAARNAALHL